MNTPRVFGLRALGAATVVLTVALGCSDYSTSPYPAPTPDRSVAVAYCAATVPTWLAFRDGDGNWTRELPSANGALTTFRHTFTSDHAAIATVAPVFGGAFTVVRVLYGTPAELSTESDTAQANCITNADKTLHGNVAGLDPNTQAVVISVSPFARVGIQTQLGLDFTVESVPSGPQDLLATRTTRASATSRLILRRDVDLPDGSLIPTLDFESAEAFDVLTPNVTIENLGGQPAVNLTSLITSRGQFALPFASTNTGTTQPYVALPTGKLLAGDLQQLHVSAGGDIPRTADVYFHSAVDRTVSLGAPALAPTISTLASDAALLLRARFAAQADYAKLTSVVYEQSPRSSFFAISMTQAYAALAGGIDLDVPNLSGVAGFDAEWTLRRGVLISWTALRSGGTFPIGRNAVPFDGATRRLSLTQGTMTVP